MRLAVVLTLLSLAAPACALDVADMPTWSAEAHVVKGGASHDTLLVFTRTAPGSWRVRAECQVTNVKTKAWKVHKAAGEARLHEGFVVGQLGPLGRVVVAGDRLSIDSPHCASGEVILGTGD
jgi:hypothetical protein